MYSVHSPQSLAIRPLLNLLLPSNCVQCKDRLSESNYCLCKGCNEALPQLTNQCSGCGTPMLNGITSPDISCSECQRKPPPFARCIAALHYMSPVDRLITRIKSDPHAPELQELSSLLLASIYARYDTNSIPTTIIPVPLHWRKLAYRGFNQSYNIAKYLNQQLPNTQLCSDVCYRIHHGKAQHLVGKQQRLRSMIGAFDARRKIPGQTVALVDDVITTGATAKAATLSLLEAGAKSVDIWCIARTGWHIATP